MSPLVLQGFRTKDGHLVVAAGNDKQFFRVCQVSSVQLDRHTGPVLNGPLVFKPPGLICSCLSDLQVLDLQNLAEDLKYRKNQLRVQNRKQLLAALSHRSSLGPFVGAEPEPVLRSSPGSVLLTGSSRRAQLIG